MGEGEEVQVSSFRPRLPNYMPFLEKRLFRSGSRYPFPLLNSLADDDDDDPMHDKMSRSKTISLLMLHKLLGVTDRSTWRILIFPPFSRTTIILFFEFASDQVERRDRPGLANNRRTKLETRTRRRFMILYQFLQQLVSGFIVRLLSSIQTEEEEVARTSDSDLMSLKIF